MTDGTTEQYDSIKCVKGEEVKAAKKKELYPVIAVEGMGSVLGTTLFSLILNNVERCVALFSNDAILF